MRAFVILALTAGALVAAGCGSSSNKSNTTTTATTRGYPSGGGSSVSSASYKSTLQGVVASIQAVAANPPSATSSSGDQVTFVQKLESAVKLGHDKLAGMNPAGPLGTANKAIVAAFVQYQGLLGQLATAAGKNDKAAEAQIDTEVKAVNATLKAAVQSALGIAG